MSNDTNTSRFISLILRHKPETIGIELDEHGYANVTELINGINNQGNNISITDLERIVAEDDKKRYSFNDEHTKIRANQGHSVQVDVELKECTPPDILYHGTGRKYIESIKESGLIAKSRLYVHLSSDIETALNVGSRHGEPIAMRINTKSMINDGYKFYRSENGVWLVNDVPYKYVIDFIY